LGIKARNNLRVFYNSRLH